MSESVLALTSISGARPATAPAPITRADAALPPQMTRRLEALTRHLDLDDRQVRERLVARLSAQSSASFVWLCLALLERGAAGAWEGPARLSACTLLAQQTSTHLRFAAYRWLARLYTIDLRCEMQAKRVLRRAMQSEQGIAARRVRQLLRTC